ncbi:NAD(P)H-dependent oxidoreductase [Sulfurimonas sp. HSL3-7]|uniref:NAD(P)H-dependent oxidoreductase n=1 Tax=Sulfonitrofixus jiaomeiensis TaxID=3131938 RepID=UPI0031F99DF5
MMKNILIIVAHPKQESLSFAMAEKYKGLSIKKGHQVDLLDLYRCEHQQPFFTFNDPNTLTTTNAMHYFQDKISRADELIFIFPYWWGGMPAIMKNFIDWNLSKGFAFEYVNSRPKGLLHGKTVKIFTTTGAPWFLYMITGAHRRLKNMWKEQIIEFCGMKLVSFNIFGGVDTSTKSRDQILEKMESQYR